MTNKKTEKSNLPNSRYKALLGTSRKKNLDIILVDVEKRLNDLEHKFPKKNNRKKITRGQKMSLFYHLGLLDTVRLLPIQEKEKAYLLSLLLDEDRDNLQGDLTTAGRKDSDLRIEANYSFLTSLFEQVGLNEQSKETEKILTAIRTEKENKK